MVIVKGTQLFNCRGARSWKEMKYLRRKREEKLYKQWSQHANLPPEAIPQREVSKDIPVTEEKRGLSPRILYILLGAAVLLLFIGVILLLVHSC